MIITFIILLFTSLLGLVNAALDAFNWVFPTQIADSIVYFFGYVNYLKGIVPITDLLLALVSFLTFWGLLYIVKLVFMFVNSIPFIGLKLHLPNHKLKGEYDEHMRFKQMMSDPDHISRYH